MYGPAENAGPFYLFPEESWQIFWGPVKRKLFFDDFVSTQMCFCDSKLPLTDNPNFCSFKRT
jgi:hypothetical protein